MKRIYLLLTACLALVACKKVDVAFTISPDTPKAGEKVTFTNQSSSGEEWSWSFGDGVTSTLKSPTHTYKKPGTYTVRLMIDNKKNLTTTKSLTVIDTVPSFVCEDTTLYIYRDYTFTAQVYNPYNYTVQYLWYQPMDETAYIPPYYVVTDTTMTNSTLHLYFTRPADSVPLALRVIVDKDTTYVKQAFAVNDDATHSVLVRTSDGDYRQRIFSKRAEDYRLDPTAAPFLDDEQDTMQVYNGYAFYLSELKTVFPELQGFHIANRKIYYRAEGLWVATIDGAYAVQIDSLDCPAMTLDPTDNRIYWANANGVWYMPFIGSDNNQFVTTPVQLNPLTGVTKIAADPIYRLTTND